MRLQNHQIIKLNIVNSSLMPKREKLRVTSPDLRSAKMLETETFLGISTRRDMLSIQPLRGFPCLICLEQNELKLFATCGHKLACNNCLEKYLLDNLKQKQSSTCLMEGCNAQISIQEKSAFQDFPEETKRKFFNTSKVIDAIKQHKQEGKFVIRSCSVVDCDGIVNVNTGQCVLCQFQHCRECFRSHTGKACNQGRRTTIFLSQVLDLKRCPLCFYAVFKEGGCNKIICPNCNNHFCAQCVEIWSFRHHKCGQSSFFKVPYFWFMETCLKEGSNLKEDKSFQREI